MRDNPERIAWTILLTFFLIFCLLAISIPLGVHRFIVTAAESYPARVTAHGDAVLIRPARQETWTAITDPDQEIWEGTALRTESFSEAFVRLFDDSNLHVRNNSQMAILKISVPRFDSSPRPASVLVRVESGKVIVGVATALQERSREFEVITPHGRLLLQEGNYSINVTETETEVNVRTIKAVGQATLLAGNGSVQLTVGQRGRIEAGHSPQGPLPGERNLVINGDFEQPLSTGWSVREEREKATESPGLTDIVTDNGEQAIHFVRQGGNQYHAENGIIQELDLDVRDASSLEVRLNTRLLQQSLSGGGWYSSEFPLMVILRYRDAGGYEHDWIRGFYYTNPEDRPIVDEELNRGILILRNEKHPFESGNLMLSLGDQRPVQLIALEIKASGHDYESLVSNVGIFIKE